jgi:hypothetical protein
MKGISLKRNVRFAAKWGIPFLPSIYRFDIKRSRWSRSRPVPSLSGASGFVCCREMRMLLRLAESDRYFWETLIDIVGKIFLDK